MKRNFLGFVLPGLTTMVLAAVVGSITVAHAAEDAKPAAGQPEMKLPPGWTAADMQACMLAGTPGKMHKFLVQGVGVWDGKTTMWMVPGMDPMKSTCTMTVAPMFDGRFVKGDVAGDMPGMGPYQGVGLYGFDNVTGKFVSTWVDNQSTGMMTGTGSLSADGKTLTWNFTHSCPITKKPATLREVETITGPNTKTLEMFGEDPKSGKEFQMMKIEFTKKS